MSHEHGFGCGVSRRAVLVGSGAVAAAAAATPGLAAPRKSPWIDAHVHLQGYDWFKGDIFGAAKRHPPRRPGTPPVERNGGGARSFAEARSDSGKAYGFDLAAQTERLLDQMDAGGIDTAILYAMDYDYTGAKLTLPHDEQVAALARVRDAHPGRFILFAAIDPRRGKAGIELLRRLHKDHGIAGMGEFAPHFFGFAPNDRERCYPIYELCAELGLHIAPNCSIIANTVSRFCDPLYFEDVAFDFPQVNLCLTSSGIPHWAESAIALAQAKPNVFLDVGDWQAKVTRDPVGNVLSFVRRALDTDARHKIMFGSDYPVFSRSVSTKTWVDVFTIEAAKRGAAFSDTELQLLFSDNAQDFLGRDLALPPGRA